MMDNGFPLTTEPSILREMIAPPNIVRKMLSVVTGKSSNVSNTLPNATASCVPWRKADLKYASNEIYVDLVEEMNAVVSRLAVGPLEKCQKIKPRVSPGICYLRRAWSGCMYSLHSE